MMIVVFIYTVVLFFSKNLVEAANNDRLFIRQFMNNKNYMVTAHLCWKYGEIQKWLYENTKSEHPNQIAVHRVAQGYDIFYSHLSTDNYFILDLQNCEESWKLLDFANETELFRFPLKHLLLVGEEDFNSRLVDLLGNYTIYPSSDVIIAKMVEDRIELMKAYRIHENGDIIWEPYGLWNSFGVLEEFRMVPTPSRRHDMLFTHYKLAVVLFNPDSYNHLEDYKYPSEDIIPKQCYGSIVALMNYCNIDYSLLPSGTYGYYNKTTKKWNGIVQKLIEREALMSSFTFLYTKQRKPVVDFLRLLNPLIITFILRKPPISYVSTVFSIAFQVHLWYALFGLLVLLSLVSYIVMKLERKMIREMDPIGASDIALLSLEAVCQQGTMLETRGPSSRITLLMVITSCMLLYVAFSGNVLVILQSTREITSLQQLLSSKLKVGSQDTLYMKYYLKNAGDDVRKALYETKFEKQAYSLEDGMKKVREGFFALHSEIFASYVYASRHFTDAETCSLQTLVGYIPVNLGYIVITKRSPLFKILLVGLDRVVEHGIHARNFNHLFIKPKCYGDASSFASVGFEDMSEALMIFSYGSLIAVGVFLFEVILYKSIKAYKIIGR